MILPPSAVQTKWPSPVGELVLVASDEGLHFVGLPLGLQMAKVGSHPTLQKTVKQLEEYFSRRDRSFDLPLVPQGTNFQKRAWRELQKIPFGQTISYKEQAGRLGDYKKARAVGFANSQNPWLIIVPCHRVIGADGSLGGYSGGVEIKKLLLNFERSS